MPATNVMVLLIVGHAVHAPEARLWATTLQCSAARPAAPQSELRAQGHAHDVAAAAFSPDGATIATGADDNKVHPMCSCHMSARLPGSPAVRTLQKVVCKVLLLLLLYHALCGRSTWVFSVSWLCTCRRSRACAYATVPSRCPSV